MSYQPSTGHRCHRRRWFAEAEVTAARQGTKTGTNAAQCAPLCRALRRIMSPHDPSWSVLASSSSLPTLTAVAGGVGFSPAFVCVFIRLLLLEICQKPLQLLSPNSTQKYSTVSPWKAIYFGVKRSKAKATKHKNSAGVGLALSWVLASSSLLFHILLLFTQTWLLLPTNLVSV